LIERMQSYEENTISKFKSDSSEVEILIVVGKLLTGFDAPRASILYIAKHLQEHGLLQAIARVNRLFEGKDFCYIIDYVGILGKLDKALTDYQALEGFDPEDLVDTVTNIADEIRKLSQRYSDLIDVFKEVTDKKDIEALERHLAPQDIRDLFREKLIAYARNLQLALASDETYSIYSEERIEHYIKELKLFQSLRASVSVRYAERINYKEYEARVRKLLDTYVGAEGVDKITEQINIFEDDELFKKEVERLTGSVASKADSIAYKMKKVISERMDEDPVFYKKFSQLIDETIKSFRDKRLTEAQYLAAVTNIRSKFTEGNIDGTPAALNGRPEARAFYGIVKEKLFKDNHEMNDILAEAGVKISEIISRLVIRDWHRNDDVQKQMENEIEDYLLFDKNLGGAITTEQIDTSGILHDLIHVAKNHYN
jgi:type I restriction enzyme R subunit